MAFTSPNAGIVLSVVRDADFYSEALTVYQCQRLRCRDHGQRLLILAENFLCPASREI